MTESDLVSVEQALDIKLPNVYRQTMLHFPIRAYQTNTETHLWDNPSRLIELNQRLRREKSWPAYLYALGDRGESDSKAIDLRSEQAPVWDVEHFELDRTWIAYSTFVEWLEEDYLFDNINNLWEGGIDPDSSPEDRIRIEDAADKAAMRSCGLVLVGLVGGTSLLLAALKLLTWCLGRP